MCEELPLVSGELLERIRRGEAGEFEANALAFILAMYRDRIAALSEQLRDSSVVQDVREAIVASLSDQLEETP